MNTFAQLWWAETAVMRCMGGLMGLYMKPSCAIELRQVGDDLFGRTEVLPQSLRLKYTFYELL